MVFTRQIRLAVVGICLLLCVASPAGATTFEFTSCVEGCIASSGCKTDSAKCMCREARELLLDSVISCMYFNCKADLRNFEDSFLEPIEGSCERSDRDIPSSKIKAAESLASSYISKLTPLTTTKSSPTKSSTTEPAPTSTLPASTPSSATTPKPSSSSKTREENTPASTSIADKGSETESTSTAEETTAAPTLILAPPAAAQPSTSRSPASDSGSGFNTDPFGGSSSAGHLAQPFFSLFAPPLAAGMLFLALR